MGCSRTPPVPTIVDSRHQIVRHSPQPEYRYSISEPTEDTFSFIMKGKMIVVFIDAIPY